MSLVCILINEIFTMFLSFNKRKLSRIELIMWTTQQVMYGIGKIELYQMYLARMHKIFQHSAGPSLWKWDWDLSFGLYDDLYDEHVRKQQQQRYNSNNTSSDNNKRSNELFLESTWLQLEGPVPSWQPLLAAVLWFVASIIILYHVSILAESTTSPYESNNFDFIDSDRNSGISSNWNPLELETHLSGKLCHVLCGIIFACHELGGWFSLGIARHFIIATGTNTPLLIGFILLSGSQFILSQCYHFKEIKL